MKQETSVTQYYAQIVGLSEEYCQKACNFKGKSRFKNLKSCHRCPNANAKFQFLFWNKTRSFSFEAYRQLILYFTIHTHVHVIL